MTHDAYALIAAHVLSSLGMNSSALEETRLKRAIRRRMNTVGLRSAEVYAEYYRCSAAEQDSLAEELYIHETCFFRDRAVFSEMLRWVRARLAEGRETLSILSAPCSTGEEPYSIAATLLDGDVPSDRFRVHAVDVSANALACAELGVYNGLSMRNIPHPEQESFLSRAGKGWTVAPAVRQAVIFERVNLLADEAVESAAYDLIFCRNLLIYLDATARVRVIATLQKALRRGGRLVLGAADWSGDVQSIFCMDGPANAFAFRLSDPLTAAAKIVDSEEQASAPSRQEVVRQRPGDEAQNLYERALNAAAEDEWLAERLCRQALYLQDDHLPALELLSRLWRSHAPHRLNRALAARLYRRQASAREAV